MDSDATKITRAPAMIPRRLMPLLALAGLAGAISACTTAPVHQPAVAAAAPAPPPAKPAAPLPPRQVAVGPSVVGVASWYRRGPGLHRTCSGEPLVNRALSAASPTLPVGTEARVTRLDEHRSVVVRVNDCMPRSYHRVIDLSEQAARKLGLMTSGIAKVRVTPVVVAENQ